LYRYVEVNTSPALFRHGRCLTKMMPKMMEECVQKCVDVVFPPPDDGSKEAAAVQSGKLDRWLQLDVEPVKFTPADVGGGGGGMGVQRGYPVGGKQSETTRGAGTAVGSAGSLKASPFQPGAGGVKPKPTAAQRLAIKPNASFK
jgi:hypothetical protein